VNKTEGLAALDAGQFDEAKLKLGRAARALELLGAHDPESVKVRGLAAEAAILADLARASLEEIVEEAARLGDEQWGPRFDAVYPGQAVILDPPLVAGPAGGPLELDYRILVGRGPVPARVGRVDLKGLRVLETSKSGDAVLFGARLASV